MSWQFALLILGFLALLLAWYALWRSKNPEVEVVIGPEGIGVRMKPSDGHTPPLGLT